MLATLTRRMIRLAFGATLVVSPAAYAQVDCSNPDNLCTGDPCVIPTIEVADPCVVDFEARSVVIDGRLEVPSDGMLSMSAGTIDTTGATFDKALSVDCPGSPSGAFLDSSTGVVE